MVVEAQAKLMENRRSSRAALRVTQHPCRLCIQGSEACALFCALHASLHKTANITILERD